MAGVSYGAIDHWLKEAIEDAMEIVLGTEPITAHKVDGNGYSISIEHW
ncbi:MAG: hypothetical protein JSR33_09755 [Proteobacteria bacterium]|nr:hypothetical protein [Pseudomonadota bacterium]